MNHKPAILLVEDDYINAKVMKYYLEQDYDFYHIADGQLVIQFLLDHKVDIVIMDINLGRDDIDGIQILKEIRSQEGLKHIKVFALSGYSDSYISESTDDKGFDLFFSKPIDFKFMTDSINNAVQQAG